MTPLAEKLDARFQKLDPETLQLLERAILSMLTMAERPTTPAEHLKAISPLAQPYHLPGYNLGVRDGIDPAKLVHAAEEE